MNHIPIAQLTLLIAFDVVAAVLIIGLSVWLNLRRRPLRQGTPAHLVSAGCAVAALLMMAALPVTWGAIRGQVSRIPLLAVDARPADTLLGLGACVLSAIAYGFLAWRVFRGRLSRPAATAALFLAGVWLVVGVDVVLAVSAVNDLAGLGHGRVAGRASVGLAVWLTILAAGLVIVGSIIIAGPIEGGRGTSPSPPSGLRGAPPSQSSLTPGTAIEGQPPVTPPFSTGDEW